MKKHILLAASAASLCFALPAAAQSIDYGSLEELFNEPVTTSATGSPQRAPEAPADMQIISQEDIRRSGATDLPSILMRVAGIDVLPTTAGHTDVNVRGYNQMSSPRLLVLVNGRQVYLDHYGQTEWRTIPVQLDEIRQIEVVKGPSGALFGFNAVSGVVNIITYNPKFDSKNAVTIRGGTNDHVSGSLVGTFKLGDKLSVRASAGAERQDEWKNTRGLRGYFHNPEQVSASLDAVAQLSQKTELRVETSWSNMQNSILTNGEYYTAKFLTESGKVTLTSDTQFGLLQATAYQNRLNGKYIGASLTNFKNKISVVSVQDLFKIGADHTFRIGGEFRDNRLNTQPIVGGRVKYRVYAPSAMWNWAINEQLSTTAAVRLDNLHLSRSGPIPAGFPFGANSFWEREFTKTSINLAAVWRPTDADTFRVSYARGVQSPSLIELGGLQAAVPAGPFTLALVGNPNLPATMVTNYQVSYDRDFAALNTKVGARVFLQTWKDVRSGLMVTGVDVPPTATTIPGILAAKAVSDSEMKGFELAASGKLEGGFHWRADYTYTDVEDDAFPAMNLVAATAAFAQTTPKSRGNVGVGWASGAWETDANLHYVSKFQFYGPPTMALAPVDAYATLSARVAYKLDDGLTFAVSGQNLLNKRQSQMTGLQAERQLLATVSKSW
jgi:outer membrane receptor for ferrienterochelin and colicins